MKAVVFGGSGFLGSHVADSLTEHGYDVLIFDKKKSPYLRANQQFQQGDILDEAAVENAMKGADYVYNFAGLASLDDASTRPMDTIKWNVMGTCNLAELCVKNQIKRFIYASSFYVHSEKGGFYRCSKQAAEIYLEEFHQKYNLPFTILRYGSLYGTRSDQTNGIYSMLYDALTKGIISYGGTGEELREYIDVKDAADLSVQILGEEYANKYIVLTGQRSLRVNDMIRMITDILDKPVAIQFGNKDSELHYNITPYVFKPKYSYKLVGNCYRDIGQGLVECITEIHAQLEQTSTKIIT